MRPTTTDHLVCLAYEARDITSRVREIHDPLTDPRAFTHLLFAALRDESTMLTGTAERR